MEVVEVVGAVEVVGVVGFAVVVVGEKRVGFRHCGYFRLHSPPQSFLHLK